MIIFSFTFFLIVFAAIGLLSALKNKHTNKDYFLANQNVKPWLVSLSAISTYNSGFMFTAMIGYTYLKGLSSIWLMIGWVVGDLLISFLVHKKLRVKTEKNDTQTFAGALSKWNGTNYKKFRFIAGIITIVFLAVYASGQLNAGSKALHVLFGWNYSVGAIIGSIIVILYCFSGGIRASIWTDAAQSIVMLFSIAFLFISTVFYVGGFKQFIFAVNNVSPEYMSLFPSDLPGGVFWGPILFVTSWLFAGFAVVGMPHVMVRFMTMEKPQDIGKVRLYYYSWYAIFFALTILVGLISRVVFSDISVFDSELALPNLSLKILPEVFVGIVLAGIFAATMSTVDSQIISCSAALTRDLSLKLNKYYHAKIATVSITIIALLIAIFGDKNIFHVINMAAASLSSSFAPLIIVYSFNQKPSEKLAICMMLVGLGTVILWRLFGLHNFYYDAMPGMLSGLIVFYIGNKIRNKKPLKVNL